MSADGMVTVLHQYQLHLPTFEGPLDVLLNLIERERMDISTLSLVSVTTDFLAYIQGLGNASPVLLAEFAGVASRLLVLKSRSLLPRAVTIESEPSPDDLAAQLRAYQRMKQASALLRAQEESGARTFSRTPATNMPPPRVVLVAPPVAHVRRALLRTLARVRAEPEVAALRRVITLGEMHALLRDRLQQVRRAWSFRDLVDTTERETLIVGFIVLLTMLRRGEITIEQNGLFAEIQIHPARYISERQYDD